MDFLTNEPQYKTIPVNDFPCCEQRPAATAVFPRASGEAPRAAETLRHPAAERKEQHRGVKNAMQLPEHGGLALKHFASERASGMPDLEKGLNLLFCMVLLRRNS